MDSLIARVTRTPATTLLAYVLTALLFRAVTLGNPVLHIDEQFYLLMGDRMLHGALPYVDIFDRKPIGLFAIYAAIRLLGGDGIIQYQLVALLFAATTAFTINRIAQMIAPPPGAWWAGVAYLLYLSAFNCFGGQAPVFFNLPMAVAGLVLARTWQDDGAERLLARGALAMVLAGLAIQIKYTAVFEGLGFGLALLVRGHRADWPASRLIIAAIVWASLALLPTALALGAYAMLGHAHEFIFANFLSIFGRQEPFGIALWRLTKEMAALIPLWWAIWAGLRQMRAEGATPATRFLQWWGIAALAGFLLFGTWYDHYVGPLLVPLTVLAAPALAGRAERALVIGFGAVAAVYMPLYEASVHGDRPEVMHTAALISERLRGRCLYINEGDPVLYLLTHSCLATRYPFPNHLNGADESRGLGIDPAREMRGILAARPAVVMMSPVPLSKPTNWQTRAILLTALARDYTRFAEVHEGAHVFELYTPRR